MCRRVFGVRENRAPTLPCDAPRPAHHLTVPARSPHHRGPSKITRECSEPWPQFHLSTEGTSRRGSQSEIAAARWDSRERRQAQTSIEVLDRSLGVGKDFLNRQRRAPSLDLRIVDDYHQRVPWPSAMWNTRPTCGLYGALTASRVRRCGDTALGWQQSPAVGLDWNRLEHCG